MTGGVTPRYVTVGMAGPFIPDVAEIHLVLDRATVGAALDLPFGWLAIHPLGGSAIGTLLVAPAERRRVAGLLAFGATADVRSPHGRSLGACRYHPGPGQITAHRG